MIERSIDSEWEVAPIGIDRSPHIRVKGQTADDFGDRVCVICRHYPDDRDGKEARAIAEHIVRLHNASLSK